jgi:hypothetical protein
MWSARWFPDLNSGQGYPFLSFYAPLIFWIAGAFHAAGADVALALKLTTTLGVLLAAFGMHRLVREQTTSRGAGFVAAALFIYAPYFVRDIFIRGDLAESFAMSLLPWSLWGMLRLQRSARPRDIAIAAFVGAAPILAHNILGLFNGILLALTAAVAFATSRRQPRRVTLRAVCTAGIGALLLSAFFWVPALLEKKFVQIDVMTSGHYEVAKHFVRLDQLLGRGEFPGGQDQGLPMSFELGWVSIAGVLAALVFARSLWKFHRPLFILGMLLFLVGTARAMKVSAPVYETFAILRYVQFPWRFLSIAALGSAILGGLAFEQALCRVSNRVQGIAAAWIALAAVLFVLPLLGPRRNFPIPSWALDPAQYQTKRETTTVGEYLPIWALEQGSTKGFENGVKIEGAGRIESAERGAGRLKATLDLPAPGEVIFQDLYFPGWSGRSNGNEIKLIPQERSGHIVAHLPAGRHHLELRLKRTPLRNAALLVSTAAAVLFLAGIVAQSPAISRRKPANSAAAA